MKFQDNKNDITNISATTEMRLAAKEMGLAPASAWHKDATQPGNWRAPASNRPKGGKV